ncbi:MAG: thiamine diphosphokinase [Desulfurispora sp.]|uniref:thiamine diphosphokinase n=1 Tax=Desulfurispora sp. TaxID=3014275 RepID=UPI0040499805
MRCVIIAGGEMGDYAGYRSLCTPETLVICADSGLHHAREMGVVPSLIIGDMDSVAPDLLEAYRMAGCQILRYPRDKDEIDTELAIEQALARGAGEIFLLACTGSRLDQSLAALHLLGRLARQGISAVLLGPGHRVTVAAPQRPAVLHCRPGSVFSILPLTEIARGVTASGLKWPLENADLHLGRPFTVSNEVLQGEVRVSLREGLLLLMEIDTGTG